MYRELQRKADKNKNIAPLPFVLRDFQWDTERGELFPTLRTSQNIFLHVDGLHQSERVDLQASNGNRCIMGKIEKLYCVWYVIIKQKK